MIEPYLTTEQVANILQVHPFTVLRFIKQGKLNGIKLGRVYRIPESDMKRFLEERMSVKPKQTTEASETRETEEIKETSPAPSRNPEKAETPSPDPKPYDIPNKKPQTKNEGDNYFVI